MVAARGGADGVHIEAGTDAVADLRERLKGERILGVGGVRSKHDAMSIGEAGADYLLFGEPRNDGSVPPLDIIIERAAWWAEIFEMPCIAYAPALGDVPAVAATGAEFVALGDAVWQHPQGPAETQSMLRDSTEGAANAVRAAARAGVPKVVLTSSVAALPRVGPADPHVTEDHWATDLGVPYFRAKTEGERAASRREVER